MSATSTKILSWSGIQALSVAVALFLIGTPAGFSICGFSWKFPWVSDSASVARHEPPVEVVAAKPVLESNAPAVRRIWTSPTSTIFCVTVKNQQSRSLHFRGGHLNLSEVGIAEADWPAGAVPNWEPVRLQLATIHIAADRELPGTSHAFKVELTVPPGHERRFLLQIDATNLPTWQSNRFFAVGSLVLEEEGAELVTADFNLFGRRLISIDPSPPGFQPTLAEAPPASAPVAAPARIEWPIVEMPPSPAPPARPAAVEIRSAEVRSAEVRSHEEASPVQKVTQQFGKMASFATGLRDQLKLPHAPAVVALPPPPDTTPTAPPTFQPQWSSDRRTALPAP